jgi:hypothetical protein
VAGPLVDSWPIASWGVASGWWLAVGRLVTWLAGWGLAGGWLAWWLVAWWLGGWLVGDWPVAWWPGVGRKFAYTGCDQRVLDVGCR